MRPSNFDVHIWQDCDNAWHFNVDNERMEKLALESSMDDNEMLSLAHKALTGKACDVVFQWDVSEDHSKLIWKKCLDNDLLYVLGTFDLAPLDQLEKKCLFNKIIEYNMDEIQHLNQSKEASDSKILSISEINFEAVAGLEKAVQAKNDCETLLIGKFVQILNEKKRKISILVQELENAQEGSHKDLDNAQDEHCVDPVKEENTSKTQAETKRQRTDISKSENQEQVSKPSSRKSGRKRVNS